jgi:hypothetical protein
MALKMHPSRNVHAGAWLKSEICWRCTARDEEAQQRGPIGHKDSQQTIHGHAENRPLANNDVLSTSRHHQDEHWQKGYYQWRADRQPEYDRGGEWFLQA